MTGSSASRTESEDELEGLPQPLRNAAHKVIFHLLEEPVPALADPFPEADPLPGAYRLHLPAGDTADAEHLMHLTWDQMTDPQNPFFTGTMWEIIGPDGTATEARTSLAHGWASGPTPILTGYVLGIQPVKPGYQAFTVTPHPGNLRWGRGRGPDSPTGRYSSCGPGMVTGSR